MEITVKKPSIVEYLIAAIFTLVVASCNTSQAVGSGGSVSGTVSYNGSPVASVNLDLENSSFSPIAGTSTTSGSNGKYTITLAPSDSSGTYYVGVSGGGYNTDSWQFNISKATLSYALDIALTKPITGISPSGGATGVGTSPTVSWSAGTDCATYEVTVANFSNPNIVVFDKAGITGTSYQVSGLTSGTKYPLMISGTSSSGISVGLGGVEFTA